MQGSAGSHSLSIRQYAAHRAARGLPGATKQAVQKAISSGRIAEARDPSTKLINPDLADELWSRRTTPQAVNVATAATPGAPAANDDEPEDYRQARAKRERYQAELARLDYEHKAGQLVLREDVEREAFRQGRLVRDNLLRLSDRLAPVLAAESDALRVSTLLELEVQQVLEALAAGVEPTPERASEAAPIGEQLGVEA